MMGRSWLATGLRSEQFEGLGLPFGGFRRYLV